LPACSATCNNAACSTRPWSSGGEFGRLPVAQKGAKPGRDHNPNAFTTWLAGGGAKGGTTYGSTDGVGFRAEENRVTVHDLHATDSSNCSINSGVSLRPAAGESRFDRLSYLGLRNCLTPLRRELIWPNPGTPILPQVRRRNEETTSAQGE
jgi:hypothetical protein